jgi:hypothetical protein
MIIHNTLRRKIFADGAWLVSLGLVEGPCNTREHLLAALRRAQETAFPECVYAFEMDEGYDDPHLVYVLEGGLAVPVEAFRIAGQLRGFYDENGEYNDAWKCVRGLPFVQETRHG